MTPDKRVFKTKSFDRWAAGLLSEPELCAAAKEVVAGRFEADLGGGLCKKRIAKAGGGKSAGTRALIAKQNRSAVFFLVGRQKCDPGRDFSDKQEAVAKMIGKALQAANDETIEAMVMDGSMKEICK